MRCTARSCKNEAEEPFRRCPACREAARAARRATRQKDPEKARRKGRECAARRRERPSPAALAHAERNRAARYAATSAWAARNPEKKARTGRLAALIHAGRIVKPDVCEDCRLPKRPLVAWGVEKDGQGGLAVHGWTCWRCRNERLRQLVRNNHRQPLQEARFVAAQFEVVGPPEPVSEVPVAPGVAAHVHQEVGGPTPHL